VNTNTARHLPPNNHSSTIAVEFGADKKGEVLNFFKNDFLFALTGPAILGGVFGGLVYLGMNLQPNSTMLGVVFVMAGVILASLAAYGLRRFLLPRGNTDDVQEEDT
jgi:hypothetical protein